MILSHIQGLPSPRQTHGGDGKQPARKRGYVKFDSGYKKWQPDTAVLTPPPWKQGVAPTQPPSKGFRRHRRGMASHSSREPLRTMLRIALYRGTITRYVGGSQRQLLDSTSNGVRTVKSGKCTLVNSTWFLHPPCAST